MSGFEAKLTLPIPHRRSFQMSVFFGNLSTLPPTEDAVFEAFAGKAGKFSGVEWARGRRMCWVTYESAAAAEKAASTLNGQELDGRVIKVELSTRDPNAPREPREPRTPRAPVEIGDRPTYKDRVIVRNAPRDIAQDEDAVRAFFGASDTITKVTFARALLRVKFTSEDAAAAAIGKTGKTMGDREVRVEYELKKKKSKGGKGRGGGGEGGADEGGAEGGRRAPAAPGIGRRRVTADEEGEAPPPPAPRLWIGGLNKDNGTEDAVRGLFKGYAIVGVEVFAPKLDRPAREDAPPPSHYAFVTFASDAEVEKGLAAYASTTDFKVEKPAEKQRRNRGRRSPRS